MAHDNSEESKDRTSNVSRASENAITTPTESFPDGSDQADKREHLPNQHFDIVRTSPTNNLEALAAGSAGSTVRATATYKLVVKTTPPGCVIGVKALETPTIVPDPMNPGSP